MFAANTNQAPTYPHLNPISSSPPSPASSTFSTFSSPISPAYTHNTTLTPTASTIFPFYPHRTPNPLKRKRSFDIASLSLSPPPHPRPLKRCKPKLFIADLRSWRYDIATFCSVQQTISEFVARGIWTKKKDVDVDMDCEWEVEEVDVVMGEAVKVEVVWGGDEMEVDVEWDGDVMMEF